MIRNTILLLLIIFIPLSAFAIDFEGKFRQGHFIIGKTEPKSKIWIDKKPVKVMKGQYGPYIKYKSLNATIPEEKDPTELTMEEALILIEKRREYDKNKKSKKRKLK